MNTVFKFSGSENRILANQKNSLKCKRQTVLEITQSTEYEVEGEKEKENKSLQDENNEIIGGTQLKFEIALITGTVLID